MSKQVTAAELAQLVTALLTAPEDVGELDTADKFANFMTEIAEAVCNHCGGAVHHVASQLDDTWYIGIHGNDSLPPGGGVWAQFDTEGDLYDQPEEG